MDVLTHLYFTEQVQQHISFEVENVCLLELNGIAF
jgi:hypothetical protein